MIRVLAAAFLLAAISPALAQADPAPAPAPATMRVTLQTSEGAIVLELEKDRAPATTANFLRYVDQKRFDGADFYRAMKLGEGFGLIQAGAKPSAKPLPPIKHEPTSETGLKHIDGTISMARGAPGSATGDFFITVGAMPSLDADLTKPGDNLGFAAFGHVVEGMDVVKRILVAPTSPTEGEGVMRGQMLAPKIRIVSAQRLP